MALPIWENHNMLDEVVWSRSWRERLFTLPWRPWVDRKTHWAPSKAIYRMHVPPPYQAHNAGFTQGRVVLMCHPVMADHIRTSVRADARTYVDFLKRAIEAPIGGEA